MLKRKWENEDVQVKILCFGMIVVLVAILIPLFSISVYNFKSVDDYSFSKGASIVWQETHSVWKVMSSQIVDTQEMYQNWQGTYFSQWFTSTLLGICGENAYYVSTILSLGGVVFAEMFLFMMLLVKGLGADKYRAAIISIGCIILQVLLTPYPVEAYFWFCGAVVYTFIHALGLLQIVLWFLLGQIGQGMRLKLVSLEIGIVLLSIAVGGSNYITGLTMLIFNVLYVIWMFWKKHKYKVLAICNMIIYMFSFGMNVLAPGNSKRQNSSGVESLSVIDSVLRSLKEAAVYCMTSLHAPCVIMGILFIPIIWNIVKRRGYRYPLPLLFSVITFGVFAAQFTPTLYALQILGAGRVQNLYRLNFFVLLYINEIYWIGWIWRRCKEKQSERIFNQGQISYLLPGWFVGSLILCLALWIWAGNTLTTVSAIQSLRKGEAQQYRQEYEERLLVLEDSAIKEVYLEPFSVKPYLLFFNDMVYDTENWVNKAMADYFDKDVVGLTK